MTPQTIILSAEAGWQNAQLFCTQGESAHPFRFKVKSGNGFADLSIYTKVVFAIDLGSTVALPVCTQVNQYEVEVAIPTVALVNAGSFPCWLVLTAENFEMRIGGIALQCNLCGIDQLLEADPVASGLLEELIEQGDYAKTQGDYAKEQGTAAETIVERWEGIPAGDWDAFFPVSVQNGGTGATSPEQARASLGAAATDHTHSLAGSSILGILPITKGGTGASTVSQARNNLGAAASNHSHSLSSSSLTGSLPITKGGTGATSASQARSNLGAVGVDDVIDVTKGGTGVTSIEAMLKKYGLVFGKGDTFNLGNYIAGGYITSGSSNFSCYIILPYVILPEVTKVSVTGLVRIRQNGKYILGTAGDNTDLATLDTTYEINAGRYGIAVSINSGLQDADNNDAAGAFFGNLVLTFS